MKSRAAIKRVERLTGEDIVRTRPELLWWLRHNGAQFVDIIKAGSKWIIIHSHNGARMCATGIRCLDDLTLAGWAKAVNDTRDGWHIA